MWEGMPARTRTFTCTCTAHSASRREGTWEPSSLSDLSSCAAAQCKRAAGLCWHLLTLLTHTRVPPPADAPRFEVHRLLMADSGTLLLCSVDTTGHLAKAS